MKPNLLRSLSNSFSEQFPLLPRIRKSFIGLLMFCILFILVWYVGDDGISVLVKPVENGVYFNKPVSVYDAGSIKLSGQLTISNPTFLEKVLLLNADTNLDLFSLLFMAIGSIIIILIVPKLQQQNLFRKDISNSIRLLGYLVLLHGIITVYRTIIYAPEKIKVLTHNEFTSPVSFQILTMAEMYFALILIALGSMYERGIKLQEELDLTI